MKNVKVIGSIFLVLLALANGVSAQGDGHPVKRKSLTEAQQKTFLAERLPSGVIQGTFGSYASMAYALLDILLHTNDIEVNNADLNSPFAIDYKPTVKEWLDTMAVQTSSSWKYDPSLDYWVFGKPATRKPYTITMADKWITEERGIYDWFKPPTQPVGMDIYYYGTYSDDDPKKVVSTWEKVRNGWATGFGSRFKPNVSISEMKKVTVNGVEALYWQTEVERRPGHTWRQWVLVKQGHAFVIVSVLPNSATGLLADVEAMVKSFSVTAP